jgi:Glycosyl transferase family 2
MESTPEQGAAERQPGASGSGRVLVIIPTYQEAENLPLILGRVRAAVPEADVLVADDDSPDGTGDLADKFATDDDQVHVLHRPGKQGLGAAYLDGFDWGLSRGYDVLVEMDADGSHPPEQLPDLLLRIDGWTAAAWSTGPDRASSSAGAAAPTRGSRSGSAFETSPAAFGRSAAPPWRSWTCPRSPPRGTASRSISLSAQSGAGSAWTKCPSRSLNESTARARWTEALWWRRCGE